MSHHTNRKIVKITWDSAKRPQDEPDWKRQTFSRCNQDPDGLRLTEFCSFSCRLHRVKALAVKRSVQQDPAYKPTKLPDLTHEAELMEYRRSMFSKTDNKYAYDGDYDIHYKGVIPEEYQPGGRYHLHMERNPEDHTGVPNSAAEIGSDDEDYHGSASNGIPESMEMQNQVKIWAREVQTPGYQDPNYEAGAIPPRLWQSTWSAGEQSLDNLIYNEIMQNVSGPARDKAYNVESSFVIAMFRLHKSQRLSATDRKQEAIKMIKDLEYTGDVHLLKIEFMKTVTAIRESELTPVDHLLLKVRTILGSQHSGVAERIGKAIGDRTYTAVDSTVMDFFDQLVVSISDSGKGTTKPSQVNYTHEGGAKGGEASHGSKGQYDRSRGRGGKGKSHTSSKGGKGDHRREDTRRRWPDRNTADFSDRRGTPPGDIRDSIQRASQGHSRTNAVLTYEGVRDSIIRASETTYRSNVAFIRGDFNRIYATRDIKDAYLQGSAYGEDPDPDPDLECDNQWPSGELHTGTDRKTEYDNQWPHGELHTGAPATEQDQRPDEARWPDEEPLEDEARWDDNPDQRFSDIWHDEIPDTDPAGTAAITGQQHQDCTDPDIRSEDDNAFEESTSAYRICYSKKKTPKKPRAAIALFAGIGGTPAGIKAAELYTDGDIDVIIEIEIDPKSRRISTHAHPRTEDFPGVIHKYHDVRQLNQEQIDRICDDYEVVYLTAGWPCTELSRLRDVMPDGSQRKTGSQRTGIHGGTRTGSDLFHDLKRIYLAFKAIYPGLKYLIENVDFSDCTEQWDEVCDTFGTPIIIQASKYSYSHRKRAYWTDAPLPPEHILFGGMKPLNFDDCLDPGRYTTRESITTVTASWRGSAQHPWQWTQRPIIIWDEALQEETSLRVEEAERVHHLKPGYTAAPGLTPRDRLHGIGNGWDSSIIERIMRAQFHPEDFTADAQDEMPSWASLSDSDHPDCKENNTGKDKVSSLTKALLKMKCPDLQAEVIKNLPEDWQAKCTRDLNEALAENTRVFAVRQAQEYIILDSGSAKHICPDVTVTNTDDRIPLVGFSGDQVLSQGSGSITIPYADEYKNKDCAVGIDDVNKVSNVETTLLSVGKLVQKGFRFRLNDEDNMFMYIPIRDSSGYHKVRISLQLDGILVIPKNQEPNRVYDVGVNHDPELDVSRKFTPKTWAQLGDVLGHVSMDRLMKTLKVTDGIKEPPGKTSHLRGCTSTAGVMGKAEKHPLKHNRPVKKVDLDRSEDIPRVNMIAAVPEAPADQPVTTPEKASSSSSESEGEGPPKKKIRPHTSPEGEIPDGGEDLITAIQQATGEEFTHMHEDLMDEITELQCIDEAIADIETVKQHTMDRSVLDPIRVNIICGWKKTTVIYQPADHNAPHLRFKVAVTKHPAHTGIIWDIESQDTIIEYLDLRLRLNRIESVKRIKQWRAQLEAVRTTVPSTTA
jgi:hypothetical protein